MGQTIKSPGTRHIVNSFSDIVKNRNIYLTSNNNVIEMKMLPRPFPCVCAFVPSKISYGQWLSNHLYDVLP